MFRIGISLILFLTKNSGKVICRMQKGHRVVEKQEQVKGPETLRIFGSKIECTKLTPVSKPYSHIKNVIP